MSDAAIDRKKDDGDGIDIRAVIRTGMVIAVALMLTGIAAYTAWHAWRTPSSKDAPNTAPDIGIAGPVLESAPQSARNAFMAEKEKLLRTYEWIDPAGGVARIPIDDAMRVLSEHETAAGKGKQ
jgi:hypothetical protein